MTAIAAFGAVVVLATSCSPTAGTETIVDEGCDDVIVVAARGSGQPDGVGNQNQAVIDQLSASRALDQILIEPVPYPAPALQDDPTAWLEGRYRQSASQATCTIAMPKPTSHAPKALPVRADNVQGHIHEAASGSMSRITPPATRAAPPAASTSRSATGMGCSRTGSAPRRRS